MHIRYYDIFLGYCKTDKKFNVPKLLRYKAIHYLSLHIIKQRLPRLSDCVLRTNSKTTKRVFHAGFFNRKSNSAFNNSLQKFRCIIPLRFIAISWNITMIEKNCLLFHSDLNKNTYLLNNLYKTIFYSCKTRKTC